MLFRLITSGFVLLTLTAVSGVLFSEEMFGRALRLDHKTVFALIAWGLFGACWSVAGCGAGAGAPRCASRWRASACCCWPTWAAASCSKSSSGASERRRRAWARSCPGCCWRSPATSSGCLPPSSSARRRRPGAPARPTRRSGAGTRAGGPEDGALPNEARDDRALRALRRVTCPPRSAVEAGGRSTAVADAPGCRCVAARASARARARPASVSGPRGASVLSLRPALVLAIVAAGAAAACHRRTRRSAGPSVVVHEAALRAGFARLPGAGVRSCSPSPAAGRRRFHLQLGAQALTDLVCLVAADARRRRAAQRPRRAA